MVIRQNLVVSLFFDLLRERKGGPATEFAIIGSVFFLILCAIFTLSLNMYWQMTLDTATRYAARKVQINSSTAVPSATSFVTNVCSEMTMVGAGKCASTLQYSVQPGTYFGSASTTGSILGQAGQLTSTGLSKPANFTAPTSSAAGSAQFLFVQTAMPVPFSFMNGLRAVVAQNGTSYLYSALVLPVEP